jgi:hypothetical protein
VKKTYSSKNERHFAYDGSLLLKNRSKTLKEDEQLIEAGFEYIIEREGTKIYHKRK